MLTPIARSCATSRSTVTWPWWCCGQHETAQLRPEMADPRRPATAPPRSVPSGVDPALAAVADHRGAQHQILHHEGLVALEARARPAPVALTTRSSRLTRGVDLPRPRRLPRCGRFGVVACSMPLGLIAGRPFRPFSRAFSSRWSATTRFSSATSPSSFTTRASSSARDRLDRSPAGGTPSENGSSPASGKAQKSTRPGFCPGYEGPFLTT